jgi:AcrR family transcriptional regulator
MPREYVMRRRADAHRETRERILRATMELHDEKGVAPTTFADIAKRAGVGQATMYRHFPTIGELVRTCGMHVWQEMRPPTPDTAAAAFEGLSDPARRVERLVEILDDFYARGELRLRLASRDRELLPELDGFLSAVEAGVHAHVAEALAPRGKSETAIRTVAALLSFPVWSSFRKLGLPDEDTRAFTSRLVACALRAAETP